MQRYFSRKQLSEWLGVSIQTIDIWRKRGYLPYIKMGGNTNAKVLFDKRDVEEYLERRKYNTLTRGYNEGLKRSGGIQPTNPEPEWEEPPEEDYDRPPDIY